LGEIKQNKWVVVRNTYKTIKFIERGTKVDNVAEGIVLYAHFGYEQTQEGYFGVH